MSHFYYLSHPTHQLGGALIYNMRQRNELGQFVLGKLIWKKCLNCRKKFRICNWNKNKKFCSNQCYWKFASFFPYSHSFQKGHPLYGNPFQKGHEVPLEWKENLRKCYKNKHHSFKTEFKKGEHYNIKENNPMWNNGSSFEPYSSEFDRYLKEQIRKFDSYICQLCKKTQKEELSNYQRKLAIHHIDYNKKNNQLDNLITLCNCCNVKVNRNRPFWIIYFRAILSSRNLLNQVYTYKNIS